MPFLIKKSDPRIKEVTKFLTIRGLEGESFYLIQGFLSVATVTAVLLRYDTVYGFISAGPGDEGNPLRAVWFHLLVLGSRILIGNCCAIFHLL